MSHKPTAEQAAVVDAFSTGSGLVVEAGAGAGKTSTLRLCAAATPRRRGLYLAYNRPLKDEAAKSFPSQVRSYTTHGLAYGPVTSRFQAAGRVLRGPRQRARDVAEILGINEPIRISSDLAPLAPAQLARLANQTVARFCLSSSEELEPWHVPSLPGYEERTLRAELRRAVLPLAQRAWADLRRLDGKLRLYDNVCLKIYQLTHPRLHRDYVLVDEAQDLNPCVEQLIAEQDHMQVVYVGDECQAINGWNGAVNAMRDAPGERLYLSESFRFAQPIADEANKWLEVLTARLRLRGSGPASRVEALDLPSAVLCRTNAEAVRQAGLAVAAGRKPFLVGGAADIRSLAEAAIELRETGSTGHPELFAFRSWREVQDYVAQDAAGSDLKVAVALIEEHTAENLLKLISQLADEGDSDLTISTAHKSKGKEWSTVQIADDFYEPRRSFDNPDPEIPRDVAMLAYVAVTRAQQVLDRSGLAWVDHWVAGTPAPASAASTSWLAAAVREHPEAILPDPPEYDVDELASVGVDYRTDPAERIAAVAAVVPEFVRPVELAAADWTPPQVPQPARRRGCPDCPHTAIAHRAVGRGARCTACDCTRVPELAGAR